MKFKNMIAIVSACFIVSGAIVANSAIKNVYVDENNSVVVQHYIGSPEYYKTHETLVSKSPFDQAEKGEMYPETALISEISDEFVTVETYSGNRFVFRGAEDYEVGDLVSMLMYGNHTAEVKDDYIVEVRYSGRID